MDFITKYYNRYVCELKKNSLTSIIQSNSIEFHEKFFLFLFFFEKLNSRLQFENTVYIFS